MSDSLGTSGLARSDYAQLAHIFARAFFRFSQNELDEVGKVEASCVRMKIEPNGTHACVAHASDGAREMTSAERLDHAAETGRGPRCSQCAAEAKR